MSTFLLLNALPFAQALKTAGHTVIEAEFLPLESLAHILARQTCAPDHIVLTAMGDTRLPTGLGAAPCPLSLVALDSCLNEFWLKDYAPLFDGLFADQQSSLAVLNAQHLPLSVAENLFVPPQPKRFDLTFVGRCQPHRLKRLHLLKKLSRHFHLQVMGANGQCISTGQMVELFAQSRAVLNENLFPGLTLRPLQAMASGSLLLSESNAAMAAFFRPGVDFLDFDHQNLLERAALALQTQASFSGRETCLAAHSHGVRARQFLALLPQQRQALSLQAAEFCEAAALYALSLRYERPQYRAFAMQALTRLAPALPAAARLFALGCARGHSGPARLENAAFLKAARSLPLPHNWQTALSWGYALIRAGQNAAPAFELALGLLPADAAQEERAQLIRVLNGKDHTWPLDMALAGLYLALGHGFETGSGKWEEERLPQNAAEYLARILNTHESFEARAMLAVLYEQCGLISEAAGQYQRILPLLGHFPELAPRAKHCLRQCYMDEL